MQPYVVRQGDFLLKVAHRLGFDPDAVWNDAKNADLRQARPNPNILFPGDVLYIPDATDPTLHPVVTGATNAFQSDVPTSTLTHQFTGATYASKAYTVQELEELTGLQTDGSGVATFNVPVTLDTVTVTFTETGDAFALAIGAMDPIDTLYGIFKRLQNLGHIDRSVQWDDDADHVSLNVSVVRLGLRSLKASQSGGDEEAADGAPSTSAPAGSAPDAVPVASSAESMPPDSLLDVPDVVNGADEGLSDDGTHLDPDTAGLLVKAHGC